MNFTSEIEVILKAPIPALTRKKLARKGIMDLVKDVKIDDPEMKEMAKIVKKKKPTIQKLQEMEVQCQSLFLSTPRRWSRIAAKRRHERN